jgi:hypothetical protein
MVSRGNGFLVPVLLLGAWLPGMLSHWRVLQLAALPLLLAFGGFVWLYGKRRLAQCEETSNHECAWWERHFDPPWGSRRFDSFMCVQMRWWAIGFAAVFIAAWPHVVHAR